MSHNKSFLIFIELREVLKDFSPEVGFEVYDAVIQYIESGTLVELKPVAKMAFAFIKKKIDNLVNEENELRRKRSEGGKKGMSKRYNSSNSLITQTNSVKQNITQVNSPEKEIPPKESSPTPPKEYTPKELDVNNKILLTRTREENELDRFDSLLQQIADGREQIWVDSMRKKYGIDNISDYLPSFRDHVIANSKLHEVSDINGFKRYFNNSFGFFSKTNPIKMLRDYASTVKSEDFAKYCKWIAEKAPNVAKELIPLSEEELFKLLEVFGSDLVFKTILDLNNRRDLIPKYYSLFRTLKNWLGKEDRIS